MAQRGAPIVPALLLCGTLDIVYAAVSSVIAGKSVTGMLRTVASGPFGDAATGWGIGGAVAGLVTHYAIMAAMVVFWFVAVRRVSAITRLPWWLVGTIYGLILYLVMNAVVLPLRFGSPFPPIDPIKGAVALFPHIFFVGWPLAWMTRKDIRRC